MSGLCQYKDALGQPGKGAHAYRIFGFAAVDIILTIIVALLISYKFKTRFVVNMIVLVVIAVFLHWLFCVPTKLNVLLGL
jgi:hypothetical protein